MMDVMVECICVCGGVNGCIDNGWMSIGSMVDGSVRWWMDGRWWMNLCNGSRLSDNKIDGILIEDGGWIWIINWRIDG